MLFHGFQQRAGLCFATTLVRKQTALSLHVLFHGFSYIVLHDRMYFVLHCNLSVFMLFCILTHYLSPVLHEKIQVCSRWQVIILRNWNTRILILRDSEQAYLLHLYSVRIMQNTPAMLDLILNNSSKMCRRCKRCKLHITSPFRFQEEAARKILDITLKIDQILIHIYVYIFNINILSF